MLSFQSSFYKFPITRLQQCHFVTCWVCWAQDNSGPLNLFLVPFHCLFAACCFSIRKRNLIRHAYLLTNFLLRVPPSWKTWIICFGKWKEVRITMTVSKNVGETFIQELTVMHKCPCFYQIGRCLESHRSLIETLKTTSRTRFFGIKEFQNNCLVVSIFHKEFY